MKNVLLLVHDDVGQEARFQAALDLTRALAGHLTCLDVTVMPALAGGYDYGATEFLLEDERKRESANRAKLGQRLSRDCVGWDWIDVTGSPADCLTHASTLADIIVVNSHIESALTIDMQKIAGDVILASHKPVLAVPETLRSFDLTGRALVAWDGSEEASTALRGALPLLQFAGDVTILQIEDGSIKTPAEDAAAYFSRHGIAATIRRVRPRPGDSTARTLLEESDQMEPAFVVMGGFSHRRWIEAITGGVSHRMLREAGIPILFGH